MGAFAFRWVLAAVICDCYSVFLPPGLINLGEYAADRFAAVIAVKMQNVKYEGNFCCLAYGETILDVIEALIIFNHQPPFDFFG